ncbi:hypothetical protein HanRHA438_Chr15g0691451 [Helianthus annuus]|nr:hypothetical protein HanRHA438_Chr15g0691451 [Helianthus annuus]
MNTKQSHLNKRMQILLIIIHLKQQKKHHKLKRVIDRRLASRLRTSVFRSQFYRYTSSKDEFRHRKRRVRIQRAFIEGEKNKFKVGKPGDEEGGCASEMNRGETNREIEEDAYYWDESA